MSEYRWWRCADASLLRGASIECDGVEYQLLTTDGIQNTVHFGLASEVRVTTDPAGEVSSIEICGASAPPIGIRSCVGEFTR